MERISRTVSPAVEKRKAALVRRGLKVELLELVDLDESKPREYICLALGQQAYENALAAANEQLAIEHANGHAPDKPFGHRRDKGFTPRTILPWREVASHPLLQVGESPIEALELAEQAWLETQLSENAAA